MDILPTRGLQHPPATRCFTCPCGYFGDPVKECTCSATAISRYQKRISGPLLDRIDIHVEVPRVDYEKLADKRQVENSETIRQRVQAARERQLERFTGTKVTCNAEMGPAEVRQFCDVEPSAEKLLKAAMQQLHLSARAYHRVLKLARTIADLAESELIKANHIAEAVQYRPRMGIVSESFTGRLIAFDIALDGSLSNRRVWAEGLGPDGITMDAEGAIWVQAADIRAVTHHADSPEGAVLRIREGGEVLQRIEHDRDIFAVTLGGPDGKTLFMLATEFRGSDKVKEVAEARVGEVVISQVSAPGAGWP